MVNDDVLFSFRVRLLALDLLGRLTELHAGATDGAGDPGGVSRVMAVDVPCGRMYDCRLGGAPCQETNTTWAIARASSIMAAVDELQDLPVDDGWRFVSIGFEGEATDVGGVNPWDVEWSPTHGRIVVAHPSYPAQRHVMDTYEVAGTRPPIKFAAGEFSNGVWGFFVPT